MTNEHPNDTPLLARGQAPDHGASFWSDLDAELTGTPEATPTREIGAAHVTEQTAQMDRIGATQQVPSISAGNRERRLWPLAAAAALMALVGLGFMATRSSGDPSTELVSGTAEESVAPLDGSAAGADGDTEADSSSEESSEPVDEQGQAPGSSDSDDSDSDDGGVAVDPAPTAAPRMPATFQPAYGALGESVQLPRPNGSIPEWATWLATWDQQALSWYGITDPALACGDQNFAHIKHVNAAGFTQLLRDPQPGFSGEVSHFTVNHADRAVAWVASCGDQVELYSAGLEDSGQIGAPELVWVGEAQVKSALLLWDGSEMSLNAINPDGERFFVEYSTERGLLGRNLKPILIMEQEGAPRWEMQTPLAASADGRVSYWSGEAPGVQTGACGSILTGVTVSTIWVHAGADQWSKALVEDTLLGEVSAAAIEPEFSQIAFADQCDGEKARLFIGTQRADGLISNLREIDLEPFTPGFVDYLVWTDSRTLHIESDNSAYDVPDLSFRFEFDDGRDQGVIVLQD